MIETTAAPSVRQQSRFPAWLRMFEPAPPAEVMITDPEEIKAKHRYWQRRVLIGTILGYAVFYLVRKNLSMAMPVMEKDLGISKPDLGLFLTLHGLLYGVSKLVNGFFADRSHARTMMVAGLLMSAVLNILFGFSSAVVALGVFWMVNGWFQGMGYPPCGRLMAHWIPPRELATKMSIWNGSTNLGAIAALVLGGYLISAFGNWRLCFWVPGLIAFLCACVLWFLLPDTPPSVGLPEVEGSKIKESEMANDDWKAVAMRYVFGNPWIWLLAMANFFIYVIRYSILDWGPTILSQQKHIELKHASWVVSGFEMSGLIGALLGGWLTDKLFGGRGFRSCFFYMILSGVAVLLFWKLPGQSFWANVIFLCLTGFFVYGPQCLLGIAAANLATKRAAATAVGLVGLFGYLSTTLSGWGLGKLVEAYGWDAMYKGMLVVAALGALTCLFGWKAKPHGYSS